MQKMMESECSPISIEQQYQWATNLDKYWKEQARRRKAEEQKENQVFGTENKYINKYQRDKIAVVAIALSLAKEIEDSIVGTNRAYSNEVS